MDGKPASRRISTPRRRSSQVAHLDKTRLAKAQFLPSPILPLISAFWVHFWTFSGRDKWHALPGKNWALGAQEFTCLSCVARKPTERKENGDKQTVDTPSLHSPDQLLYHASPHLPSTLIRESVVRLHTLMPPQACTSCACALWETLTYNCCKL